MSVTIKRIYEQKSDADGKRVLVDRVWPRGVSKEQAALDDWAKEVAPSPELRKWFNHEKEKFEAFAKKYQNELQLYKENSAAFDKLVKEAVSEKVTLLYAAKNETYNHAVLLKEWIDENIEKAANKS